MKKVGLAALVAATSALALPAVSDAQVTQCPGGVTVTDPSYCVYYQPPPPDDGDDNGTKPRPRLTLKATPKRDARRPFRFTARGRLRLPADVTRRRGCRGSVRVTFRQGKKILKRKNVQIKRSNCRYVAKRVKVKRVAPRRRGTIKVRARFNGNSALRKRDSTTRLVRYGRKRR